MQRLKKGREETQEAHSTSQREMVLQSLFSKKFTSAFFVVLWRCIVLGCDYLAGGVCCVAWKACIGRSFFCLFFLEVLFVLLHSMPNEAKGYFNNGLKTGRDFERFFFVFWWINI